MVRGAGQQRGAHSDESDSDWDSLAQPAIQQQQQQPAVQLQLPKDVITPPLRKLERTESIIREAGTTLRNPTPTAVDQQEPRRGSAESGSGRSISTSAAAKAGGPLTFIDRQQITNPPARSSPRNYKSTSPAAAAAAVFSKRDPLPDPVPESTDEDLPVVIRMNEDEDEDATDVEEIEFQQQLGRTVPDNAKQEQHRFGPKQLSRSIVTDVIPRYSARPSSDGFDNAAFEGSRGKCSPPPPINSSITAGRDESGIQGKMIRTFSQLPKADETIEIFPYDNIQTEFHQVSEKTRKSKVEGFNETIFETSTRFWAEVTAVFGLPLVFLLAFLLQLLRFVTVGLLRPLLIGLVNGLSDGLLKPLLAALHNALITPTTTFLHNCAMALKLILTPLAGVLELVTGPLGRLFGSCRLVEIHHHHEKSIRTV